MKSNIMGKSNWSDTGTTTAPATTPDGSDNMGTATSSGNPTTATQPATQAAAAPAANAFMDNFSAYEIAGLVIGAGYAFVMGKRSITSLALYAAIGFGLGWVADEAHEYIVK